MLRIGGVQSRNCAGISRRTMLEAGAGGLLGLTVPKLLAAEATQTKSAASNGSSRKPRAKSVIFLFLFGGPSQFETFDMKPEASSDIRGPFQPIPCKTPDLRICEHLPKLAAASDKFCVIRSMSHDFNDHSGGGHYIQTGHRWHIPIGGGFSATPQDWPSMGSVVEKVSQARDGLVKELPSYMVVPNRLGRLQAEGQYVRPGEYAGWLGSPYNPLTTTVDRRDAKDNPYYRNCTDAELDFQFDGLAPVPSIDLERMQARASLLQQFDSQRRLLDGVDASQIDALRQRALGLANSAKTREALDVRKEPKQLRDRYGRHLFGQSTLLARRLVEAGVRFVTVHYDACDGYGWDSHIHSRDVKNHLMPTLDQALSALLEDLENRGLLDETLVVALGEMGRTAKPTPDWGRGHWSTLFPAVVAGAGVRGGIVYGASDKDGQLPIDNKTSPEDLAATIYEAMGIDPEMTIHMPDGRPIQLVSEGTPVRSIFG